MKIRFEKVYSTLFPSIYRIMSQSLGLNSNEDDRRIYSKNVKIAFTQHRKNLLLKLLRYCCFLEIIAHRDLRLHANEPLYNWIKMLVISLYDSTPFKRTR